jgi:DNA-binding transcriptional LysR family regulator
MHHNCLTLLIRIAKMNNSAPAQFDWSLVRSFLAALDAGSLLGASRGLGVSQPTVGRHIAELESQWGVALFERTGRGLKATEAATALAQTARAMDQAAMQLARHLSGSEEALQGSVRISASQPTACYLLPDILARMRERLPQIRVELVVTNEVSNLLRRDADIALRMLRPQQATLIAKKVAEVSVGVYAHKRYLHKHGTPRVAQDLMTHSVIGDDVVIAGFRRMGQERTPQDFALFTSDLIAQSQAVAASLGIGFLADYVVKLSPGMKQVQRLLPGFVIPPLPIWLTVHREIRGNQRIRAVYDLLAQEIPLALQNAVG